MSLPVPEVHSARLVQMTLHLMSKGELYRPFAVGIKSAAGALHPPLTTGQVDLLRADNVASGTLPGLQELKIQPKAVEEVVPTYIGTRAPGPH
jgi:NADH dehydrogenase